MIVDLSTPGLYDIDIFPSHRFLDLNAGFANGKLR